MGNKQPRAALYIRVSTAAQNLDGQEAELTTVRGESGMDDSETLSRCDLRCDEIADRRWTN